MCGDALAAEVAKRVRSGVVGLTTWYLAGNHLSAEGITPLCEAMEADGHVRQLWLKRNPLKPAAGVRLGAMLEKNVSLQVLDLVNCGLL